MSRKEVPRAGLLKAALAGKITNAQGALAMHVSVRQFQRVKVRFAAVGGRAARCWSDGVGRGGRHEALSALLQPVRGRLTAVVCLA